MVDDRCLSKDDANIANFYIIRAYSAIFSVLINMFNNMWSVPLIPLYHVKEGCVCNVFG